MKKLDSKTIKYIVRAIIIFLVFWHSAYLQYIPIYLFRMDVHSISFKMDVILSTFSNSILVLFFIFLYRKDLKREFLIFKENLWKNIDIGFRYWSIGLLIMLVSNAILYYGFHTGGANNENALQELIKALPWLMVVDAGILAPFNEEIVFRKNLKDIFSNKWIFAGVSFFIFGLVHVVSMATNFLDYLYIIPYGALGGAFALAYHDTDTIFTSFSLHMFHNIVLTILSII